VTLLINKKLRAHLSVAVGHSYSP